MDCFVRSKVVFILNELESVEYLRETTLLSFLTPVTLNNKKQRLFNYQLIGRQCNTTWTVFKKIYLTNSTLEHVDTNEKLCTRITYPGSDAITSDNNGQFLWS